MCYMQALEIDSSLVCAWIGLGHAGGGKVNQTQHTKQKCYVEALGIDPDVDQITDLLWAIALTPEFLFNR